MKLFLIDDERINNLINHKILKRANQCLDITEFTDSQQAFDEVAQAKPDLIFLDLNMPDFNGWDFLDKMKAENILSNVVILTSSVSRLDHNKAVTYNNVIAYIEKPLTSEKAVQHLQQSIVTR